MRREDCYSSTIVLKVSDSDIDIYPPYVGR